MTSWVPSAEGEEPPEAGTLEARLLMTSGSTT